MSRSLKKGPYVDGKLLKKVEAMNRTGRSRSSRLGLAPPRYFRKWSGIPSAVHDGRRHVPVYVSENMVGHKLGEFAPHALLPRPCKKREEEHQGLAAGAVRGACPGAAGWHQCPGCET